jgi:isoleucyl-tRNA synthetase
LKELVVFHTDPEYHEDVKKLQNYVEDELNVHQITYSSDEAACGVKYKAGADWAVLGRRLKKDLAKVKRGLEGTSSEQLKQYLASSKMTIEGIEIGPGDLTVSRYVDKEAGSSSESASAPAYENNTDEDVVILLDCKLRPELESEGFAREMMNRIQRLRKKAGAVQTDDLDVYYQFSQDSSPEDIAFFENVLRTQAEVLCRVLRKVPDPDSLRDSQKPVLAQELQERWGSHQVTFTLVRV